MIIRVGPVRAFLKYIEADEHLLAHLLAGLSECTELSGSFIAVGTIIVVFISDIWSEHARGGPRVWQIDDVYSRVFTQSP